LLFTPITSPSTIYMKRHVRKNFRQIQSNNQLMQIWSEKCQMNLAIRAREGIQKDSVQEPDFMPQKWCFLLNTRSFTMLRSILYNFWSYHYIHESDIIIHVEPWKCDNNEQLNSFRPSLSYAMATSQETNTQLVHVHSTITSFNWWWDMLLLKLQNFLFPN
jgi:hypothetical protein